MSTEFRTPESANLEDSAPGIIRAALARRSQDPADAELLLHQLTGSRPAFAGLALAEFLIAGNRFTDIDARLRDLLGDQQSCLEALTDLAWLYRQEGFSAEFAVLLQKIGGRTDCGPKLMSGILSLLSETESWPEILQITHSLLGEVQTEHVTFARALALLELGQEDRATELFIDLVVRFERPFSHLLSELLKRCRFLDTLHVLTSIAPKGVIAGQEVLEARRMIAVAARRTLDRIKAGTDSGTFVQCVRTLLEIGPGTAALNTALLRAAKLVAAKAVASRRSGDLAGAVHYFGLAVAANPGNTDVLLDYAGCLAECGKYRDALYALLVHPCEAGKARLMEYLQRTADWAGLSDGIWLGHTEFFSWLSSQEKSLVVDFLAAKLAATLNTADVPALLDIASVLDAVDGGQHANGELMESVRKRSLRGLRRVPLTERTLTHLIASLHLSLWPNDDIVQHRFAKLKLRMRAFAEARALVASAIDRDPHREDRWNDLRVCCQALRLPSHAAYARMRADLLVQSHAF